MKSKGKQDIYKIFLFLFIFILFLFLVLASFIPYFNNDSDTKPNESENNSAIPPVGEIPDENNGNNNENNSNNTTGGGGGGSGSKKFTVIFNTTSAAVNDYSYPSEKVSPGSVVTLPAPAPESLLNTLEFKGWYTKADNTGVLWKPEMPVRSNMTLYAKWNVSSVYSNNVPDDYSGDVTTVQTGPAYHLTGDSISVEVPADSADDYTLDGYTLTGWYTLSKEREVTGYNLTDIIDSMDSNKEFNAVWKSNPHVIFSVGDGRTNVYTNDGGGKSATIPPEVTTSLSISNVEGFDGWYKSMSPSSSRISSNDSGNIEIDSTLPAILHAKWNISIVYNNNIPNTYDGAISETSLPYYHLTRDAHKISTPDNPNFEPEGFTLLGWNKSSVDGMDIDYRNGDVISNLQENHALYAVWIENPTITFHVGETPKSVRTNDGSGRLVNVPDFDLNNPDTEEFIGWYSSESNGLFISSDSSGTITNTKVLPSNLYAIWNVSVTYGNNLPADAEDIEPMEVSENFKTGENAPVNIPSDSNFKLPGYILMGWNTTSLSGTDIDYSAADTIENIQKNTILYAVWSKDSNPIITFHVGTKKMPVYTNDADGKNVSIPEYVSSSLDKIDSVKFEGWYDDSESGELVSDLDAGDIEKTNQLPEDLYARWNISVVYNNNLPANYEGIESYETVPEYCFTNDTINIALSESVSSYFELEGYALSGWNTTSSDGNKIDYDVDSSSKLFSNTIFYAVWEPHVPIVFHVKNDITTVLSNDKEGKNVTIPNDVADSLDIPNIEFDGWYDGPEKGSSQISADGSGDIIVLNSLPSDLYAKWNLEVIYNNNVPSELGIESSTSPFNYLTGDNVSISPPGDLDLSFSGYNLSGWNITSPSGEDIDYDVADEILNIQTNTELYAVWNNSSYVVIYNFNPPADYEPAGSVSPFKSVSIQPGNTFYDLATPANIHQKWSNDVDNDGYLIGGGHNGRKFNGWSLTVGGEPIYQVGPIKKNTDVYAIWE